jgi:hypothetical protein
MKVRRGQGRHIKAPRHISCRICRYTGGVGYWVGRAARLE